MISTGEAQRVTATSKGGCEKHAVRGAEIKGMRVEVDENAGVLSEEMEAENIKRRQQKKIENA